MHATSDESGFGGSQYWVSGYPRLVEEWDYDRNGTLSPDTVSAGSGRRIWWRCRAGSDHVWRAKPNNRTAGSGCPFCTNRKVSVTNSLATCFPRLAAEWHPLENGKATPAAVVATSARVAWWRCRNDASHEWRATVRDRTRGQTACPYCSHRRVSRHTSLAECHPTLGAEWHPTRNGSLQAEDVLPGSDRVVWWCCRENPKHAWKASVVNRTCLASGCPICARRRNAPDT